MPKYVVRYGAMRSLGVFTAKGNQPQWRRGTEVIARTNRGLESGEILCAAAPEAVEQIKNSGTGQILRRMSPEDLNERAHMESQARHEFEVCEQYVQRLQLDMELVDIERVFGGERIVVYYLAEERIDFRELVRQLAAEFQTRIEMRQIGVRDEARLLADYGDCGKPVCCNTHLSAMPPVSMKMAKIQKATLDPTKISGRCGRLKCCLRYEYDTYVEMQRELPPIGSDVITNNGRGTVLNQSILAAQVLLQMEDGRRVLVGASEIVTVLSRGRGVASGKKSRDKEAGGGRPRKEDRRRGPRTDNDKNDKQENA